MLEKHALGAIPDIPDLRDFPISRFLVKGVILPRKYDRSGNCLSARDQGNESSCVAFAACGAKESQEKGEGYLSTRFLYERIKQEGGGAFPRDAMDVLLKIGVPPEMCQPYIPNMVLQVCPKALDLARPNKIRAYARLVFLSEMKQCLYQNGCFMIAVAVTDKWDASSVENTGIIPEGGFITGYHAVKFVAYDDDLEQVKFHNSWSRGWGDNGFGYLKYDQFMRILADAWSFVDVPESEEEQPVLPIPKPSFFEWLKNMFRWMIS